MEHILRSNLPKGVVVQSYTDDLVLYTRSTNNNLQVMQAALKVIGERASQLGLVFSPSKTKAVAFGRRELPTTTLQLHGVSVEWVKEYKYLGVYIDSLLTFNKHVSYTISRVQARVNAIKFLACAPDGPCAKALKMIHTACIQSILDYGAPAMLNLSKKSHPAVGVG